MQPTDQAFDHSGVPFQTGEWTLFGPIRPAGKWGYPTKHQLVLKQCLTRNLRDGGIRQFTTLCFISRKFKQSVLRPTGT